MTNRHRKSAERLPEGRGCLYFSLGLVFLAVLVFVVTTWISAPGTTPAGDARAGAPASAPPP